MRLPSTAALLSLLLFAVMPAHAEPPAPSTPPPDDVDRKVEAILGGMTVLDKIDYVGGVDGFFVREIPKAGVPRLKMADGPLGVRNFGPATAMAAGIGLAASWNPDLAQRVGRELGRD